MKKFLILITALVSIPAWAFVRQTQGILILHEYGGEPVLEAGSGQNPQTAPWIYFRLNGAPVFQVPANGIILPANGGTGTNSLGQFVQFTYNQTYTTNSLANTNFLFANSFGINTGATNVNVTYTLISPFFWKSTNGTAIYSNATIGAFAISNAFGDLLYTNSQVNYPTNVGWSVGSGTSPAGGVTNNDQIIINYNPSISGSAIVSTSISTNTANFQTFTNDLITGGFTLLKAQRSTVTISIANTSLGAGIVYSNAATGLQHTYLMTPGSSTQTNTFTLRCQPSSLVAPTNCKVILNTTEIDYE